MSDRLQPYLRSVHDVKVAQTQGGQSIQSKTTKGYCETLEMLIKVKNPHALQLRLCIQESAIGAYLVPDILRSGYTPAKDIPEQLYSRVTACPRPTYFTLRSRARETRRHDPDQIARRCGFCISASRSHPSSFVWASRLSLVPIAHYGSVEDTGLKTSERVRAG